MSGILIRPAELPDMADIVSMYKDLYTELGEMALPFGLAEDALSEIITLAIRSKMCGMFIAENDEIICGFVSSALNRIDRKLHLGNDLIGKISDIYVRADYRKQGAATLLLRRAEQWLADGGASAVVCDIISKNVISRAFFGSAGYETISRQLFKLACPI